MDIFMVVIGGAIGALTRYLVIQYLPRKGHHSFPWATFTVNVTGSLILGATAASTAIPASVALAVGTGFCGALTTFSTFGFEATELINEHEWKQTTIYIVVSVIFSLITVIIGWVAVGELVG